MRAASCCSAGRAASWSSFAWARPRVQDHPPDHGEPVFLEEHVLGPAEADPLGPELDGTLGITRVVGVCPDLQPAEPIGPLEQGAQVLQFGEGTLDRRNAADEHLAGRAVDRDLVAFAVEPAIDPEGTPPRHR
ncbi:MAG: hypothetical protein KatS3mg061_1847 [Dehalococcoidia bacterium]|nr:MAG: hypothetical protein KatS3mg061_1847 [Dehalococcoidia bacterium]